MNISILTKLGPNEVVDKEIFYDYWNKLNETDDELFKLGSSTADQIKSTTLPEIKIPLRGNSNDNEFFKNIY